MSSVLLEARPFRPFKSGEEYLEAMKEDLAEWLQTMYPELNINADNFMEKLETGVALCKHANAVKEKATEYVKKKQLKTIMTRSITGNIALAQNLVNIPEVKYFCAAKPQTFFSRDNVSNFIHWCRKSLQIIECLLFETDDLIMRKNEKHVILCLLEVGRGGAKFGMLAPMLVQMERQIDREIAADQKKLNEGIQHDQSSVEDEDSDEEDDEPVLMYGPAPQIVTNDLKSLDEMVRDLVEQCTCPTQFPMIRVSEGKYRIGDTKVLIFVRILRNHVMVRVGGGWDTLSHYLDKHDPCRCRSQHRTTQGARLVNRPGAADLHGSQVYYDRSTVPAVTVNNASGPNYSSSNLGPPMNCLNRFRAKSPGHPGEPRALSPNPEYLAPHMRSRSPTPNFTSTHQTKLTTKQNTKSPSSSPIHQSKLPNGKTLTQHITSVQIPIENKIRSETSLQINEDHSDTTSEVSDEGYRSLGAIQDKTKPRTGQDSLDYAEDNGHNPDALDDTNDLGLKKTNYSQIYDDSPQVKKDAPTKKERRSAERIIKETNTWSGRSRHTRGSIPMFSNEISCERRHSSTSTSPTKVSLKEELINMVSQSDNDAVMVEKVQELLKEYGVTKLNCDDVGNHKKFSRGGEKRKSYRSPRKDPKPDNVSRIPAPVL